MQVRINGNQVIIAVIITVCLIITVAHMGMHATEQSRESRASNLLTERLMEVRMPSSNTQVLNSDKVKIRLDQLSISLADLWCGFKQLTYTGGFCLNADEIYMGGNHMWDLGLCQALEDVIGKKSIGDLGAGLGPYGRCLLRRKEPVFILSTQEITDKVNQDFLNSIGDYIKEPQKIYLWEGFDGAGGVERLSNGFIKQRDLTEDGLWLGRKYDWVISLEVGEHIPAVYEKIYLDNLVRHSCQGIIMSWAGPNQPGHHHVNGHPLKYVREKMAAYGMYSDNEAENILRQKSTLEWFKKNLLVFKYNSPRNCTNSAI